MHKPKGTVETRGTPSGVRTQGRTPVAVAAEKSEAAALARQREQWAAIKRMFSNAEKGKWGRVLSEINKENINERDGRGRTLLMLAASQGEYVVAQKLVLSGSDVNLEDNYGRSALRYALRHDHPKVALLFKAHGANWKEDLYKVVDGGRALMVQAMRKTLGATDADIEEAEARCSKGRSSAMGRRVRRISGEANALQELTVMFQPEPANSAKVGHAQGTESPDAPKPKEKHTGFLGC